MFEWQGLDGWVEESVVPDARFVASDTRAAAFGFTELLPSWNPAGLPGGHRLTLWVRTRDRGTQQWSPWLYIGQWGAGDAGPPAEAVTVFAQGRVAIDVLELDRPADALQMGVGYIAGRGDAPPVDAWLRRLLVVISGPAECAPAELVPRYNRHAGDDRGAVAVTDAWRRDLPVPFLAQKLLPLPLWSRGCSPTSLAMVLRYRGLDGCDPTTTAEAVYDRQFDIYGNWGRAVAYAGSLGLDAELVRFRTWGQLEAAIAAGQPVIASIRFGQGEFPSNPMGATDGHLIVIRGLTAEGDAIVNDPALSEGNAGDGIIYKRDELARAWLGKGGVAYLIRGRIAEAAGPPTSPPPTGLRRAPGR